MKKILFIVGSERKASFNRQLADYTASILEGKAEVEFLNYGSLTFINQDSEYPASEELVSIRKKVDEADGLWIFSPEYNYSYPGLLKNLIDVLSRPLVENDWSSGSTIGGKKVTVSAAAGDSAGANVIGKLSELLGVVRAEFMDSHKTGVAIGMDGFMTNKLTLSDEDKEKLAKQAEAFISFIG